MKRNVIDRSGFNPNVELPYDLRLIDFEHAMQDVYDFFADVNTTLAGKGLQRMDDMTRPAIMSGFISDMITATLAKSSRTLVENNYFNGHPDLVVRGIYENDSVKSGSEGVEIKSTRKEGGAVDTHGARAQWMCVFVYEIDNVSQPVRERFPMQFTEVYLSYVTVDDFRRNDRGELGTRTATLHAEGVKKLREGWVYKAPSHGLKAKR
ncbi:hypothetical protein [Pseudomonas aeruginosa]|nr:hypothetical protein [Pseudomonas aeruginosa]HEK0082954.1 hypothetical protein [Pseudomonas aeruginosa]HEK0088504.1 hypothetical protein [Pseudomonas aeruginosa]HEK1460981.1 hypothetical protein [Pseudomonas aeruginosa]